MICANYFKIIENFWGDKGKMGEGKGEIRGEFAMKRKNLARKYWKSLLGWKRNRFYFLGRRTWRFLKSELKSGENQIQKSNRKSTLPNTNTNANTNTNTNTNTIAPYSTSQCPLSPEPTYRTSGICFKARPTFFYRMIHISLLFPCA